MKIAIPKERRRNETRVAASPETVRKFAALGFEVTVEIGAGAAASIPDDAFAAAGATIAVKYYQIVIGTVKNARSNIISTVTWIYSKTMKWLWIIKWINSTTAIRTKTRVKYLIYKSGYKSLPNSSTHWWS